jgi:hypothetical protein
MRQVSKNRHFILMGAHGELFCGFRDAVEVTNFTVPYHACFSFEGLCLTSYSRNAHTEELLSAASLTACSGVGT